MSNTEKYYIFAFMKLFMTAEIVLYVAIVVEGKSLREHSCRQGVKWKGAACYYPLHKGTGPHSLPLAVWSSWSRNKEKNRMGDMLVIHLRCFVVFMCVFFSFTYIDVSTSTHRHTGSQKISVCNKTFNKSIF